MSKPRLVLIGNGMAGVRTVEELLKIKPDHYDITIFGAEPHPNYNRILLSPVLAGEMGIKDIILNELDWYRENNITLHTGKQISTIDRVKRKVIAEDGTEEEYDRLLIATGSTPFMLPIPGNDLPGVIGYRDIKDTDEMIEPPACTSMRWSSAAVCWVRSRQRPETARHGRDRRAPRPLAARTPARRGRRQDAAEVAGRQGPQVPAPEADRNARSG